MESHLHTRSLVRGRRKQEDGQGVNKTPVEIVRCGLFVQNRGPGKETRDIAALLQQALGRHGRLYGSIIFGSTCSNRGHSLTRDVIAHVQVTVSGVSPPSSKAAIQRGQDLSVRHRRKRSGRTRSRRPANYTAKPASQHEWPRTGYQPAAPARRTHVHVRRAGSANGRYALLFRDYLRTHPLATAAYAQVKQALARHGPTDWDLYYEVKDPVCDIIMAGAEAGRRQAALAHPVLFLSVGIGRTAERVTRNMGD